MICKECNKSYNVLTKEGTCAYCYKKLNNSWSLEFSDRSPKSKK